MLLARQSCPNCGAPVKRDARFCGECAAPLGGRRGAAPGGTRPCPYCQAENAMDAKFCGACGRSLGDAPEPALRGNIWRAGPDDFAVRIEREDLKGRFFKDLEIQPGQQAVFLKDGQAIQERVGPGRYQIDSFFDKLLSPGFGRHVTALVVRGDPVRLDFQLEKLYTRDDFEMNGRVEIAVQVDNPVAFFANVLGSRQALSRNDLRGLLFDQVKAAAQDVVGREELQTMARGLRLRENLATAMEVHLQQTLAESGLSLSEIKVADFAHRRFDALRRQWEDIRMIRDEAEAETARDVGARRADLGRRRGIWEVDLEAETQETAEQRAKARIFEERAEVWEAMRQAVLSEKMNAVRNEEDLQDFLRQIDERKLIRQEEIAVLAEEFEQRKEDRAQARAHTAYLAQLERDYSRKQAELALRSDYTLAEMASALVIEQQKLADAGLLDEKRWQNDLAGLLREGEREEWQRAEQQKQAVFERQEEKDAATHQRELAKAETLHQLELQAIQTDSDLSIEQKQAESRLAVERLNVERDRIRHEEQMRQERAEDEADMKLAGEAVDLMAKMKQNKLAAMAEARRIAREDELTRAEAAHQQELARLAQARLDEAQKQAHEVAMIQARAEMSAEALISLSGPEQAKAITDLKRSEAMKGMTDEQVYALVAERSPAVAAALAERFKAMQAQPEAARAEVRELYERMLSDIRQDREKDAELRERADQRFQQMFDKALESQRSGMVEIARAASQGQSAPSGPIIITNPVTGQPQIIQTGPGGAMASAAGGEVQVCPKCHSKSPVGAKHCTNCGYGFYE